MRLSSNTLMAILIAGSALSIQRAKGGRLECYVEKRSGSPVLGNRMGATGAGGQKKRRKLIRQCPHLLRSKKYR